MIGIVFTAYNVEPYVREALSPFLCMDCHVSAVSVPFEEYRKQSDYEDQTTNILREYHQTDQIDLVDSPRFIKEHEARNLALKMMPHCDLYWLVDGDEIYTEEQINNIVSFVENNEAAWYSLALKNYVFDKSTYMANPFRPPRIFRAHYDGDFNPSFYWDNDISYERIGVSHAVSYKELSHIDIPKEVAWIDHYTWLNDEIGKRKVQYQRDHFGHCSFKWVDDHLEFDESYFEMTGEEKPELIS